MKKIFFLAMLLHLNFLIGVAQELKIGDKLPDLTIGKIINYPVESIRFSEIKSRLVILDYWATSCSSCIAALPEMDRLQKKFGKEIFILPVTIQSEARVMPFWKKNKYASSTSLPTIVEDSIRKKHFESSGNGVPFEVWILDGKIFAFTSSRLVNEKEIKDVLSGVKKDWGLPDQMFEIEYDYKKNLLVPNENTATLFYTTITGKKAFVLPIQQDNFRDNERKFTRFLQMNTPIISLYREAYRLGEKATSSINWLNYRNRKILEVKNKNKYYPSDVTDVDSWNKDHTFCYESILPAKTSKQQFSKYMVSDLNKFFNLQGYVEKRKTECWVLRLTPGIVKIKDALSNTVSENNEKVLKLINKRNTYKRGAAEIDLINDKIAEINSQYKQNKGNYVEQQFKSISGIVDILNNQIDQLNTEYNIEFPPLIDESNYISEFNISLKIPVLQRKKITFDELKSELSKHGLDLQRGFREIDMFILAENDYVKASK